MTIPAKLQNEVLRTLGDLLDARQALARARHHVPDYTGQYTREDYVVHERTGLNVALSSYCEAIVALRHEETPCDDVTP